MRNEAFFVYIEEKGDSRGLLNMFSFLLAKKIVKGVYNVGTCSSWNCSCK